MKARTLAVHTLCMFVAANAFGDVTLPKVTLTEKPDSVVLDNGLVSLQIQTKTGDPLALIYRGQSLLASPGYLNWHAEADEDADNDEDAGKKANNSTYTRIRSGEFSITVNPANNEGNMADACISQKFSGKGAPFDVELHYVLRRGDSGFYEYVVFRHPQGYPEGQLGDARMLFRVNDHVFDFMTIDDQRRRFMPPPNTPNKPLGPKESLMMTDGPFKGVIEDKYHDFTDAGEHFVHGWEGSNSGLGCWILYGSTEDENGGPTKQHNNAHFPRILMKILTCGHYGAAPVKVGNETWQKIYGPFMIYLNSGTDVDALWADAKNKAAAERTAWPYAWMQNSLYPTAAGRGAVDGQLRITDSQDASASPSNAWVGLAAAQPDWQQQSANYQYWVRADKNGRFNIRNIRPGAYTLYAFTDGVMDEFRRDGVTVEAGRTNDLQLSDWKPARHGRQLWQIGIPDRTAKEFRHGDDYRQWGLWNKYPEEFLHDVNFTIGKSHERTDWNFAQCTVQKNGQWVGTKWNILFDIQNPLKPGAATLRIALAAAHKAALRIYVNGKLAGSRRFDTDNAMMRAGIHGQYSQWDIPFDNKLLKPGQNIITLDQQGGKSVQKNVMYDCIRLEVTE